MKRFGFMFALCLMLVGLAACGNSETKKDTGDAGTTKEQARTIDYYKENGATLGFDNTFVPMGFQDENGNDVGFDIDMATEAMERLGIELKLQPINWDLKETELNNGNIDFIWNGYSIDEERQKKVQFSKPYLDNTQVIVVLSDSNIKTKADLAGVEVATQRESSAESAVAAEADVLATFKNGTMTLLDNYADALRDLESGRVGAVVGDAVLIRYYIDKMGAEKFYVLEEDFGKEQYGVGMRKSDTELVAEVNRVLDEMKADGTAAKISQKWFGENIVK